MAYSDLHRDLLLQQLLDEMVAARSTSTDLNTRLDSIEAYLPYILKSDGTDGQVLRSSTLELTDGTNANTAKAQFGSTQYAKFNGDSISSTDNIAESTSWTGNFMVYEDGVHPELHSFWINYAGLSGQVTGILSANIIHNTASAGLMVSPVVSSGYIALFLYASDGTQITDIPALLDAGNVKIHITYITSA